MTGSRTIHAAANSIISLLLIYIHTCTHCTLFAYSYVKKQWIIFWGVFLVSWGVGREIWFDSGLKVHASDSWTPGRQKHRPSRAYARVWRQLSETWTREKSLHLMPGGSLKKLRKQVLEVSSPFPAERKLVEACSGASLMETRRTGLRVKRQGCDWRGVTDIWLLDDPYKEPNLILQIRCQAGEGGSWFHSWAGDNWAHHHMHTVTNHPVCTGWSQLIPVVPA